LTSLLRFTPQPPLPAAATAALIALITRSQERKAQKKRHQSNVATEKDSPLC
jgi:hypothetical protein